MLSSIVLAALLVGSANKKVLMFRLSHQLPASLFSALTVCCNGRATFQQNIPLWVLDDCGMGEGMNEWVSCR